jgi:hypothetical protein
MTLLLTIVFGGGLIVVSVALVYALAGPHPPTPPPVARKFTKRGDALFRLQGWHPRPHLVAAPAPYNRPPDVQPDQGILPPPRPIDGQNGE